MIKILYSFNFFVAEWIQFSFTICRKLFFDSVTSFLFSITFLTNFPTRREFNPSKRSKHYELIYILKSKKIRRSRWSFKAYQKRMVPSMRLMKSGLRVKRNTLKTKGWKGRISQKLPVTQASVTIDPGEGILSSFFTKRISSVGLFETQTDYR